MTKHPIPYSTVSVFRDPVFWLAVGAAAPAWWLGVLWLQPATDWAWPLHQPRDLLFLVLLYPLAEEWLFRGVFQGELLKHARFRRRVAGLTLANLTVGLVFTALHFLMHPPLAALAVLVPALIFGYFRDRHGRLLAPILLHAYYNLGYFWIFSA